MTKARFSCFRGKVLKYFGMRPIFSAPENIKEVSDRGVTMEDIKIPEDIFSDCKRLAKQNFRKTKEKWSRIFFEISNKEIDRISKMVKEKKDKLSELGRQVTDTQRALALAEQELNEWNSRFRGTATDSNCDYLRELYLILKLEGVETVEIEEESKSIIIYTDTIYITHLKRRFKIGVFKIKINLCNGICFNGIKVENLFGRIAFVDEIYDHPFCNSENFCFGELEETINSALNKKEFAVAVEYILQALHSGKGAYLDLLCQWREVPNE